MNKNYFQAKIDAIFEEVDNKAREGKLVTNDEMKRLKFEVISWRERRFRSARKCIFDGCNKTSIIRSHSIQKSKSLKLISEENHVLQPMFNEQGTIAEMTMKRVGINDASTFPGFCKEHEQIFSEFESKGVIDTIYEAQLQSYRNICREIVFNTNELDAGRHELDLYLKMRNKKALDLFRSELERQGLSPKTVDTVTIDCEDKNIYVINKIINRIEEKLMILKKYKQHLFNVITDKNDDDIYTAEIIIDMQFPISLCGIASVGIDDNGIKRVAYCILNIIPAENSTSIIIAGLKQDAGILKPYWEYYTQNNISILNMIESYMIHGSDHWFIAPSVWNELPPEKQKIILNDILVTDKSFLDQFPLSIFDSIRSQFIKQLENQQKWAFQKNIQNLIEHEKKKFLISNYKPVRSIEEAIFESFRNRENFA